MAWIFALVALLAYASLLVPSQRASLPLWAAAWCAHGGLLLCDVLGLRLPELGARLGLSAVLSWTVWLVLTVHALESHFEGGSAESGTKGGAHKRWLPWQGIRTRLALAGVLAIVLPVLLPGPAHTAMVSSLAPWHWLLGISSYALLGMAVLHAWLLQQAERRLRQHKPLSSVSASKSLSTKPSTTPSLALGGMPLLQLERLTFSFVHAAWVVLSLALLLGAFSTPAWHWTHKTVFSILGWVVLSVLVWGRWRLGWRGQKASRWLYGAAMLLLLAYVGSRFVMEVLLHRSSQTGL